MRSHRQCSGLLASATVLFDLFHPSIPPPSTYPYQVCWPYPSPKNTCSEGGGTRPEGRGTRLRSTVGKGEVLAVPSVLPHHPSCSSPLPMSSPCRTPIHPASGPSLHVTEERNGYFQALAMWAFRTIMLTCAGDTDKPWLDRRDSFLKQVLSNSRNGWLRDDGIISIN